VPGVLEDVLLQALQRVGQRRLGQAQVVADLVDLGDDLVAVLLADADVVHDLTGGHGNLGRVDAVGAEHRTAAALAALVEVAVPLVQHLLRQLARADQAGEQLAGLGEVAAVDAAEQVLAGDRHVLGVAGAQEVVALVGARPAFHAGVQVDLQRAVLAQQVAHLANGLFLPVVDQFTGEAQRLVVLGLGDKGLGVRHRVGGLVRLPRNVPLQVQRRGVEISSHGTVLLTCTRRRAWHPGAPPRAPRGGARGRRRPGCGSG